MPRHRQFLDGRSTDRENRAVPVPRITKEALKQRLEVSGGPLLLDVRLKYPYEHSTVKLPGALRLLPQGRLDTSGIPKDRDIVRTFDLTSCELACCGELINKATRVALKGASRRMTAIFDRDEESLRRLRPPRLMNDGA